VSLIYTTNIRCDHGEGLTACGAEFRGLTWRDGPNVTATRKEAGAAGWRRIDRRDYCPNHVQEHRP
jgi:hypothetical protein